MKTVIVGGHRVEVPEEYSTLKMVTFLHLELVETGTFSEIWTVDPKIFKELSEL